MIPGRLPKSLRAVAAGLVVAGFAAGPAQALPIRKSHATMVLDTIDQFLVPRLEALTKASGGLATSVDAVCKAGGDETSRKAAAAAFGDTVRAWGGLDFIRFGPAMRAHRLERIFFWPDPRGFASRQLNGLLAAKKPELLAPGALASQSVAVQGLTALEILLFDEKNPLGAGTDEAAKYRCALAAAIAANIHAVAGEIHAGWTGDDGFRRKMLTAGSDNALYKDATETVREVAKALATGLELCRDRFVVPELTAVTAKPPRRARLAFEPSGLTGDYLEASLVALKELYEAIGFDAYVPADKPWMTNFLPTAWKSLLADGARLDTLRKTERGSEAHLHALRKMRFDLGGIRNIIVKELAPNADIVMGFNELDGD
ncbi:imelysin family protein [Hyphomicrobium sp.]|uniref:imelysin family protein n=1 Tax=Hyphomicrobium sp. TaxID=82 RepID=UPI0025C6176A|nr:imelysin family protein [Hyphomicrobium sp.]MCC7252123.1 imelysin family protein [Hyphomicrobium sp.]